jgi:tetratricopeptide (TPR) repeat protein
MIIRSFLVALSLTVFALPVQAELPNSADASLSGSYLIGRVAGKQRDNPAALEFVARALQLDPDNQTLIERLFQLQVAVGQLEEAGKTASQVLTFNSQHRLARTILGLKDFKANQFAEARANFAEAAYSPIGELTSALLSAWTFAAENNLADALNELNKLDTNESFASFKTYHTALITDFMKSPVRAEASFKKSLEQSGARLRITQAYGNFLERNGRASEAVTLYNTFLTTTDRNALVQAALANNLSGKKNQAFAETASGGMGEGLFSLASAMTDEQSADVAVLYTQMALAFTADKPVVTTLLGDLYESTDRYEEAISAYEQTPKDSPLRNNADTEIALNFQRLDRTGEAQARLKEVISRDPKNYAAILTLGNIHRNNDNFKEASIAYDQAVALVAKPTREHWRMFYYRAIANERQKLWPKAEADFRTALRLEPDEPTVLNYLGYSMVEKKINLDEAIMMIKKAVEAKPNDGYIVDSLGWAYYQLADYENALVHMERAVELTPSDPLIAEHLGDVYWQVGRKLEAQFQWQHAKDNKPEPEDLKRIEVKLKEGMASIPPATKPSNG